MAASERTPGIPKIPATLAVATLIGTCNPIELPNAFKKNKNMPPITSLAARLPIKRSGLNVVPAKSRLSTKTTMTAITINGPKIKTSPSFTCFVQAMPEEIPIEPIYLPFYFHLTIFCFFK